MEPTLPPPDLTAAPARARVKATLSAFLSRSIALQTSAWKNTLGSVALDAIRGAAAFAVFAYHVRLLFFGNGRPTAASSIWARLISPFFLGGHEAVVVFFVMSGLLVGGSVVRSVELRRFSWRDYMTHRLVRLWIVLIPALILGALWDGIGSHLHTAGAHLLYSGNDGSGMLPEIHQTATLKNWISCFFFLNGIVGMPYGTNGALWSLAYEFWYYLIFPCAVLAVWSDAKWWQRLLYGGGALAMVVVIGKEARFNFEIWLLGVALGCLPLICIRKDGLRLAQVCAAVLFVASFGRSIQTSNVYTTRYLGIATLLLLWTFLSDSGTVNDASFGIRLSRRSAHIAFTLYALHLPILVLLGALVLGPNEWQVGIWTILKATGVALVVLAYVILVAQRTELQTQTVLQAVSRRNKRTSTT